MCKPIRSIVTLFLSLVAASAVAHHSFQATFQTDARITVEGVVTDYRFKNPHVLIYMDVTSDDGSVTQWMSEGPAATNMRRLGWSRESLKPGDLVRIHGDSTHDGSPMVSIERAAILDPETRAVRVDLSSDRNNEVQADTIDTLPMKLADGRPNLTGSCPSRPPDHSGPPRPPPK